MKVGAIREETRLLQGCRKWLLFPTSETTACNKCHVEGN